MGGTMRGLLICGMLALSASPTLANKDDGLVQLHDLRAERGKVCMATHFHDGSSVGGKTEKHALQLAIRNWESFTAWEYGAHWGRFSLAGSQGKRCTREQAGWACSVEGRPCRLR